MSIANHMLDANQTLINSYDAVKNRLRVDSEGTLEIINTAAFSNIIKVNANTESVNLLDYNPDRKGFFLFNDSDSVCYIKFGVDADTDSYTFKLGKQSFYEFPSVTWSGPLSAIWDTANGFILITEIE